MVWNILYVELEFFLLYFIRVFNIVIYWVNVDFFGGGIIGVEINLLLLGFFVIGVVKVDLFVIKFSWNKGVIWLVVVIVDIVYIGVDLILFGRDKGS